MFQNKHKPSKFSRRQQTSKKLKMYHRQQLNGNILDWNHVNNNCIGASSRGIYYNLKLNQS